MNYAGQGGYDPHTEAGGFDAELARLEAQAQLSWEAELAILMRLVSGTAPRLLEVGCGGGAITRRLLSCWPDAQLTVLEPDAQLLDRARSAVMADGLAATVRWVRGSILDNALPNAAFDLILVRFVFQHLDDPVAAARALLPKLAGNGRLLVIDVDGALWGAAEPSDPALTALHERVSSAPQVESTRPHGDRLIGRKLWRILHAAGFQDCRHEAYVYHSGEQGLAPFERQLNPERWLAAVASGALSLADYVQLLHAHQRFIGDPDAYVMLLGFAAHGRRPSLPG